LWSLDKLNAATNGRPTIVHDRDIGLDYCEFFHSTNPPFWVWLRLSEMLDKVIDLYRPASGSPVTGWEDAFMSFEEVLSQCDALNLEPALLGTSFTIVRPKVSR
jgi:hypothetical protein